VLALLLELARFGCIDSPKKIRKVDIATNLGVSAWTLNRWLNQCIKENLIEEILVDQHRLYKIKEKGLLELLNIHDELNEYFKDFSVLRMRGKVTGGLGEGKYYMSIPEYREGFKKALGFYPYPGTLNLELDEKSLILRKILEKENGILIQGFTKKGKKFCSVKCFKALIIKNDLKEYGGVILVEKTRHPKNILEVISSSYLRETLYLEDGNVVELLILRQ